MPNDLRARGAGAFGAYDGVACMDEPAGQIAAPIALTFDVEDYFHIEAARHVYFQDRWGQFPSRIEPVVEGLLELLAQHGATATFFMLGHVAMRKPHLARRMVEAGHEVACHGTMHDRLVRLGSRMFRPDIEYSRKLLEDQSGGAVRGYRAPQFSLVQRSAWAVEVLSELGFAYDSSLKPGQPMAGRRRVPAQPFELGSWPAGRSLLELPPLTWRVVGREVLSGGGTLARVGPKLLMKRGVSQACRQRRPAVLFFQTWEFDPQMPRVRMPLRDRMRTYWGLSGTRGRLDWLLRWAGARQSGWSTLASLADAIRASGVTLPAVTLADEPPGDGGDRRDGEGQDEPVAAAGSP